MTPLEERLIEFILRHNELNVPTTANEACQTTQKMLKEICRVCLVQTFNMNYLFDETNKVAEKLNACTSIASVYKDDGYPQYICENCLAQLIVAHQFKEICEMNDAKLRSIEINKFFSHCDMDKEQEEIIVDTIDNMHEVEINHVDDVNTEYINAVHVEHINEHIHLENKNEIHMENIDEVQIENINKVEIYDNVQFKIEQPR